jgi:hypothetical protein
MGPAVSAQSRSRTERLAAFFQAHPNEWISALDLMPIAGGLSWRTRVSDCRRRPHNLTIENRQRRVRQDGRSFVVSEYRYLPREEPRMERGAVAGGDSATALLF